jgi:CubicO group peptidase (beta-lactamase class C family)
MVAHGSIWRLSLCVGVLCLGGSHAAAQSPSLAAMSVPMSVDSLSATVDRIFERWDRPGSAGCAVGVGRRGKVLYTQGYGMANLELGVRIRRDTIFEAGSVAKQFTAAAIALLAQDGRLSIDDPVRKYVPELPDFGTPILIRHLLNQTSGLRSQWPMLALSGRPPQLAVHTVDEIIELVSRYKELNFKPGDEYLYNNTGFTLLGVVVQRVSGTSLDEFSQERLFKPLGMSRTQWRDDFTKIVKGRATAYSLLPNGQYRTSMPFTNVIGNGGLLTTVGDLLVWNENLDNPRVGGRAMVDQLQTRGTLNDGFVNEYAQGLTVTEYRGVREVSHDGSTAGYQTFLARFPDEGVSVAVLCNTTGADPGAYTHQIADVLLAGRLKEPPTLTAVKVPAGTLEKLAGLYRERSTDAILRVTWDKEKQALQARGLPLVPTGPGVVSGPDGPRTYSTESGWPEAAPPPRLVERDGRSKPRFWDAERPFTPTPAQLASFAGDYYSDELGVTYTVHVEGGLLEARFRPAWRFPVTPAFADAFEGNGMTLRFTRTEAGTIDGLLISADRVRHVRFVRR